jgi:crotonobetainyl-CoA:carnitine CoA-transferase CaiB-like acyl-CoA transferase
MDEVFADPQVRHLAMTRQVRHPVLGPLALIRTAVRMTGEPATVRTPSPDPGEHTAELLAGLGYSPAQIEELRAQAAI